MTRWVPANLIHDMHRCLCLPSARSGGRLDDNVIQPSMLAGSAHTEQLWRFASDLAPLPGSLASRDTRAALAAAFASLAKLLPDLQESSALLTELNAMSATEVCLVWIA